MEINRLTLSNGYMSSNCYVLTNNFEAIVIDPGFEDRKLYNFLETKNLVVTKIILTHGHFDHWGGLKKLREIYTDALLYASSLDHVWYEISDNNPYKYTPNIDYDLNKIDTIRIFDDKYKIIKVPGHSSGSIALFYKNILISGDVLFYEGIGRYDLMEGNYETLIKSIKKLYTLLDDVTIYSGHGRVTTIGHEKLNNPFIKG